MATYNIAPGGSTGYPSLKKSAGVFRIERKIDIAALIAAGTITTQLAQNDVLALIEVPANTLVLGVSYRVVTALTASGTTTMEVGDGDNTAGYIAAASVMSAATTQVNSWAGALTVASPSTFPNSSEAYSVGKFYSAADTIDAKFPAASNTTVGVIKVVALMCDFNITV